MRRRRKKDRIVSRLPRPANTPKGPQAPPPTRQAAAGRGPVIPSVKRPVPIWMGPLKAAKRRGDLGADAREPTQLRYGVTDRQKRDVAPFRLPDIQLSPSDSAEI
jgi:hypothetical protein